MMRIAGSDLLRSIEYNLTARLEVPDRDQGSDRSDISHQLWSVPSMHEYARLPSVGGTADD